MVLKNLIIISCVIYQLNAFAPSTIIEFEKADNKVKEQFGEVSRTYTHEDIIREGVIRSVVKYFSEQKSYSHAKINLS